MMTSRKITKGQWKGWEEIVNGMYSKSFGPNGQNPCIHAEQGHFYPYDAKGHSKGRFGTYKEALKAIGQDDHD